MGRKKVARNQEFGARVEKALVAAGFVNSSGGPDILRFCRDKGWNSQDIYQYKKGRVPETQNLFRLARDLRVRPDWLYEGEGDMVAEQERRGTGTGGRGP